MAASHPYTRASRRLRAHQAEGFVDRRYYLRKAISAALDAVTYIVTNMPGNLIWYDEALETDVLAELRGARLLVRVTETGL